MNGSLFFIVLQGEISINLYKDKQFSQMLKIIKEK